MHARARRRLVQALGRDLERCLPVKWPDAGHHLVEHDAERVDVRRGRDRTALNLFGSHVRRGPDDLGLRRHVQRRGALVECAPPRQTEIGHDHARLVFRARRLHQHDVVALEVAVHDSDAVRGRQPGGHLSDDWQDLRRREPSIPLELLGQRLAVQQLHREKHDVVGRVVGFRGS